MLTVEGLLGGALWLIHARIARRLPDGFPSAAIRAIARSGKPTVEHDHAPLPWSRGGAQGAGASRRAAPPRERSSRRSLLEDPFKGAGMRLTYRTVCVLLAVAERSGASNRQIGKMAGITDQGQISKLLGRLRRLGLVSNTGLGPGQGAPNAWTLTGTGGRVVHRISASTKGTQ